MGIGERGDLWGPPRFGCAALSPLPLFPPLVSPGSEEVRTLSFCATAGAGPIFSIQSPSSSTGGGRRNFHCWGLGSGGNCGNWGAPRVFYTPRMAVPSTAAEQK